MDTLHITNGDATVELLQLAGIEGTYLPWRDMLHMGPVPLTENLAELSKIRAQFIASLGWGDYEAIHASFKARDRLLVDFPDDQPIVLWFEHNLYDQLQILQVLTELKKTNRSLENLFWIDSDIHLGTLLPADALRLLVDKNPISIEMMNTAEFAWQAYCRDTPEQWAAISKEQVSALPYLHDAIIRSLEDLPCVQTGLTKTEAMAVNLIREGYTSRHELFRAYCVKEHAEFHGDASFFWFTDQLITDTPALLEFTNGGYRLTETGFDLVNKKVCWNRHYSCEHWLGGYPISQSKRFFWDNVNNRLVDQVNSVANE